MNPITKHKIVHIYSPLCFVASLEENITCSRDWEEVTCPYCWYYFSHPEARELELRYRQGRV